MRLMRVRIILLRTYFSYGPAARGLHTMPQNFYPPTQLEACALESDRLSKTFCLSRKPSWRIFSSVRV